MKLISIECKMRKEIHYKVIYIYIKREGSEWGVRERERGKREKGKKERGDERKREEREGEET